MFKVKLLSLDAKVPTRATEFSAGLDLSSIEDTVVPANKWIAIPTGISIQIPKDCYARVAPRSGLAFKHGIQVGAGVVDSDYTGTIKVILFNHGSSDFEVKKGDRIAQLIFEKIYNEYFIEVEELDDTVRGDGGFGSTGV